MDTIFLYNQNNDKFPTDVVRYFSLNNNKYFIFTLNEVDDNNYVQLYASRIENEFGKLTMKYISDDAEWNAFKDAIQKIVIDNRNGIKNESDLDYTELDGMVVTEFRIFKLRNEVAKELSMNKNVIKNHEPKSLEAASAVDNNLSIEEILRQVSNTAKENKNVTSTPSYDDTEELLTPRTISSDEVPYKYEEDVDYKKKYNDLLDTVKNLENENLKLVDQLIEYKAKLATIKDILNMA